MDHCFAFFVVFRQRPRRDRLNVTSTKSGTTVGVENIATSRLVNDGPNFEPFSQFPSATVQDSAASAELRGLTLITCSLGEVVKSLLARNLQTDRFKSWIHDVLSIIARYAFAVYASPAVRFPFQREARGS